MTSFEGKVALVTGAGSGIGEKAAWMLHTLGAKVFVAVHSDHQLETLTQALPGSEGIALDVRNVAAVETMVGKVVGTFGGLDYAVNCVGITGPAQTPVHELDAAVWDDVIATDLSAMFYCLKYEIKAMLAQKGKKAIVNMSSGNRVVGVAGLSAYTAAKHAVIGLTRSAALEVAELDIRINAVAPGYVETPKVLALGEKALSEFREAHPMKRLAKPEELAKMISFLLSEESSFATGGVFPLDGGFTAQ